MHKLVFTNWFQLESKFKSKNENKIEQIKKNLVNQSRNNKPYPLL